MTIPSTSGMVLVVRLTNHARQQMNRRRITVDEISEALKDVQTAYPGVPDDRTVVLGVTKAGRRLKVVVKDDLVITVAGRDEEG